MKRGNLVAYCWTWKDQKFHEDSGKIGLVISDIRLDEDVIIERLYRENGLWNSESESGVTEAVDVLWTGGSIEACPIENLIEVNECQIGN